jgi:hypothetical protein
MDVSVEVVSVKVEVSDMVDTVLELPVLVVRLVVEVCEVVVNEYVSVADVSVLVDVSELEVTVGVVSVLVVRLEVDVSDILDCVEVCEEPVVDVLLLVCVLLLSVVLEEAVTEVIVPDVCVVVSRNLQKVV